MSFTDEYLALKKKKKKEEEKQLTTTKTGHSFTDQYISKRGSREFAKEEDIAPVRETAPTKKKVEEEEDEGFQFFQRGAFEDGYQFGDVTKSILGTVGDVGVGLGKGVAKTVGGIADLATYGFAAGADALGNHEHADKVRAFAQKNIVDDAMKGTDDFLDKYSVLGRTTDSIAEGLGQVGTIILTGGLGAAAGLGAVGASALTAGVVGASSFGSGMTEAYQGGATDEEAARYGLNQGVIDAGTELLFGGLGKGVKALGLSKGLSSLDDIFARKLSSKIANQTAKNFVEYGVKASAEGFEEVIAGIGSAVNKKLTYMSEAELSELVKDENLLELFVVGSVTSGIAQSGLVPGMKSGSLVESIQTDRDFISGLSTNEQKVIDKVYEDRIAESEKDGKKLTKQEKSKLYDAVISDMERGYISTDTIEEVLGGDTYKSYKDTIDSEDALQNEFDTLNKMKQGDMTGEQIDRRAELKEQLAEIKNADKRNRIQSQLRNEVFGLVKGDRLVESYNERSRRGQAFEADLTKYDDKHKTVIQKAIDSGILNNTNRTHEFVDMIAKISADKGVLFDFTNNEKLKGSSFAVDGKTVNGFVTKDGVTLNIDSAKSLNSVVGHEITHVLEGTELYTELQNVLVEYAKSKGDYQGRYDSLSELYKDIEGADVNAELTADLVGDYLFTDSDFINNLSTKHRNVFQKIYDEIKYLCKVATAGSKEARELEKVKRAFEKAYKEGGKAQASENDIAASDTKYSMSVTDKETIDFLENQEHITTYKAMQVIDGKLYPPMAAKVKDENGKYQLTNPSELGKWQQATEDPTNIKKMKNGVGYYVLNKGDGTSIEAAYNPYEHSSNLVLNDQFESAHRRDNLVVVECEIPVSEMSSGYKAQYAKDGTGVMDWKSGVVAGKIKDNKRQVYLSRYLKPVRILSDSEVAGKYKEILDGTGVSVPFNVVQPSLLAELEKAGVDIDYEGSPMYKANQNRAAEKAKAKYSLTDSDGKQLTKEQQEYFKDSKVRDENGNLRVVYHGTNTGDFTVFNPDYIGMSSGDDGFFGMGFYFAYSKGEAAYYGAKRIIPAYLNLKNPFNFDRELQTYNGKQAKSGYAPDAVALMNFSDKFPEIAQNVTIGVVENGSDEVKDLPIAEFAKAFKDVIENKSFEYQEITNDYGEKETLVLADPETHEYEYGGVKHSYKDYGFQKRFWGEANELDVAYEYLSNSVYNYVNMLPRTRLILDNNREFTAALKQMGYDGAIQSEYGDEAVAFYPEQIKNTDNINPTADPDIRYSLSKDSEGREISPAVQNRFSKSKVVDEDGNLKVVYHGTATGEFSIFDKSKGSVEGDFGSGFYFTDNEADVSEHYEGGGPDFDIKVGRRADEIYGEEDGIEYEEAEERARAELFKGSHKFEVYLNIENPAIVGKTMLLDNESYLEQYNEEDYDDYDDYLADVEQLVSDDIENIVWEVERNCDVDNAGDIAGILYEAYAEGGIDIEDLKKRLNNLYLEDSNGNLVANEVARQIIESLGYDGIIDPTVSGKWNMDIEEGTTHYIVFKPNQIKAVTNQNPTDNPDIHRSLSAKGEAPIKRGNYNVYGKDIALEAAPIVAENATVEEAAPVVDAENATTTMFPDDLAPMSEPIPGQFDSLTDADMPPEVEAPYYEDNEPVSVDDPFENRDIDEVGNRKVKAYMYENPEVKPFFQAEAAVMLRELQDSQKGERYYADVDYGNEYGYVSHGVWTGQKRNTSDDIAYLLDERGYTYKQIEAGLNAIIEDNGKENNACSKRIEFILNDRLKDGYTDFRDGTEIPPDEGYLALLEEKQITEYSKEAFDALLAQADQYEQSISEEIVEDIAPVAAERVKRQSISEPYEAIRPKRDKQPKVVQAAEEQPRLIRADSGNGRPGEKQRKWVGTSTESEAVDGKILPKDLDQDAIHYQPIANKVTLGKANNRLDSMGYDSAISYFNSQFANKSVSLEDVALGERLIQEAIKRGDTKTAGELIQNVSILGTELGQKVQALSIIKRLTPEGQLGMLRKTVERGKTKGDKAFEGVELTQEMIDKILSVYNPDGTYDQTVLNEVVEDVKQDIADKMKVTAMDKVNAWRYLAMLGNPKTHIRNLVSNVAMRGTMGVKDALARTIETVAPIGNRTKTWESASEYVQDYAKRVTAEMKDEITGENRYSEGAGIKQKRKIFQNKVLNSVYEFNSDLLGKEDWWFSKGAFTKSLSEFLTANGIRTAQDIKKHPEIVAKARQYALEQSQIATFRQYSWLANKINEIEHRNTATDIAVGAVLPFKKTPINIAKAGLNYSPLGFAKTLTYDMAKVKKGDMEASEMIDHLAQNITGSALALVGYMLAQSGLLNGAGDDDKEGDYDYQLGKQAYSVNIGGATYSLSWLSPVAMPMFVGVNAYEQLVEGKAWNGDVVVETLAQTLDPLSEMSFISSLDSVLSSYDSGIQKFAGIGETMAQNYVTQFVPTLSSQVATVLDDTKRSTKVAGDSSFKFVDQTINSLKYKIPFLRETLEPTTDIWGNEVKQTENVMVRAFETFIAPYSKRDSIATEIDEEIRDLYAETGETGLIPSIPYNYINYDGEKYKMSAGDYTEFKQKYGQTASDLMADLFATDTYRSADSEARADMVDRVYDYARDEARREYFAKFGVEFTNATEDGEEVYRPNSIKGAIDNDMTPDEYSFYREYPDKYDFFKENGISYEAYASADEDGKRAYSWAFDNPGKYTMSKVIADDFMEYYGYKSAMNDFDAKDASGETVSGLKKERVTEYINGLDLDYGQKIILYRSMYDSKADQKAYNMEIVEYLNSRTDISYEDTVTILKELGFEVDSEGNVYW